MQIKILSWNIQHLNAGIVDDNFGIIGTTISTFCGAGNLPDVIFLLENKNLGASITQTICQQFSTQYGSQSWRGIVINVGGSRHTTENILCIYQSNITATPYLTLQQLFSNAPFFASLQPNGAIHSSYRLPAIVNLSWRDSATNQPQSLAVAACHSPGPGESKAFGVNAAYMARFPQLNDFFMPKVFIGDFNTYDTSPVATYFTPATPNRRGVSGAGYHWIGTSQGTTINSQGQSTNSPLDRVYAHNSCPHYVSVTYMTNARMFASQISDHIPIIATLQDTRPRAEPSAVFFEQQELSCYDVVAPPQTFPTTLTIAALINLLNQSITASSSFILNDATLATNGLDAFIKQYPLQVDALKIGYATPIAAVTDNTFTLQGATCSLLNLQNLVTTIQFWIIDGNVSFAMQVTTAPDWQPSLAFDSLKKSELNTTHVSNSQLVFVAGNPPDNPSSNVGFNLQTFVPLNDQSAFSAIKTVFSTALDQLQLRGPLATADTDITVDLKGSLGQLKLPGTDIVIDSYLRTVYNQNSGVDVNSSLPATGLFVGGVLPIGSKQLDFSARALDKGFLLTCGDARTALITLSDVTAFLSSVSEWSSVTSALNTAVSALPPLALTTLAIGIDYTNGVQIPFINLQIESDTDLQLGWDTPQIQLTKLTANIALNNPFAGESSHDLIVGADIAIGKSGKNTLSVSMALPDFIARGRLCLLGQSIGLNDLISDLFGSAIPNVPDELAQLSLAGVDVEWDSKNKTYSGTIFGSFTLAGILFQGVTVNAAFANGNATAITIGGMIVIGGVTFNLNCDLTTNHTIVISWSAQDTDSLTLNAILSEINAPFTVPSSFDVALTAASFTYDLTTKNMVLTVGTLIAGVKTETNMVFLAKSAGAPQSLLNLTMPLPATLGSIPVAGNIPSPLSTIQLSVASDDFNENTVKKFNTLLPADAKIPSDTLNKGISLSVGIVDIAEPLILAFDSTNAGSNTQLLADPSAPATPPTWITIGKSFGPFTLNRLGFNLSKDGDNDVLSLSADASVQMSALTVSLYSLAVGFNFTTLQFTEPSITGLGINYSAGAIDIGGSFLAKTPAANEVYHYAGTATVQTSLLNVTAFGDYVKYDSSKNNMTSFFVFGRSDPAVPFGGPPYFYVTGFAAGFGVNQQLRLPSQDEVVNFPLVLGSSDPTKIGGAGADPMTILSYLEDGQNGGQPWITGQEGEEWLAVGLDFTSFEIIQSRALLIAEFGEQLKLSLLGRSWMQLPQVGTPLAYVEMGLQASFDIDAGVLAMTAAISPNSYVLDKSCSLTGGFAFYMWFKSSNDICAGDFVVTLGGYHPAYQPPSHYPTEPRLGYHWTVSSDVSISGQSYFALTPSCVMAGGSLSAVYQCGDLRAWFDAYADFLLHWKPFYYEADAGISIGVSYHLNLLFISIPLKVELGANLSLWGPPFGGSVHVNWIIISFTVNFGANRASTNTIAWNDFKQLLPARSADQTSNTSAGVDACKIKMVRGLVRTEKSTNTWIVRPDELIFQTESIIPLTSMTMLDQDTKTKNRSVTIKNLGTAPVVNIKPMGLASVQSTHQIEVQYQGEQIDNTEWDVSLTTGNVPEALWGQPAGNASPSPSATVLPGQWTGVTVQAPPATRGNSSGVIDMSAAFQVADVMAPGMLPLNTQPQVDASLIQGDVTTTNDIQTSLPTLQPSRASVANYLSSIGLFGQNVRQDAMTQLAADSKIEWNEKPLIRQSSLQSGK